MKIKKLSRFQIYLLYSSICFNSTNFRLLLRILLSLYFFIVTTKTGFLNIILKTRSTHFAEISNINALSIKNRPFTSYYPLKAWLCPRGKPWNSQLKKENSNKRTSFTWKKSLNAQLILEGQLLSDNNIT